ncbi:MAG: immunoglobulin domain-containing protein, partial [Candidatus Kapabacteria bacterium]|nr:immunoglobulin domain-containing protein [Candidatus Kapabacteria bacterium]
SPCGTPQLITSTIVVTVGTAVAIVNQPQDKSVAYGSTVTVTVDAVGTGFGANSQLFYRWYKGAVQLMDDNRINGSTTGTLTIRGVQPADVGSDYTVVILGQCGQVTSRQFAIVVPSATITSQPQGKTPCESQSVSFSVAATPTVPGSTLTYQWYRGTTALTDGGSITGSTGTVLTISSVTAADSGDYTVQIIVQPGGAKIVSNVAHLGVVRVPSFIYQSGDTTVCEGTKAVLSTVATGNTSYKWKFNGADIPGATNAVLELPNVTIAMSGAYTVQISNACYSITSNAATISVSTKPSITTQPAATTSVNVNGSFTLTVTATGTTPLTYQWRRGGTDIPSATTSSYTVASAKTTDEGDYTCVIRNECGEVVTANARVNVSTVGVGDATMYGYTISQTEPHPVTDVATIHYTVAQQGVIRIILTDVNGRLVTTLCNEMQTEGNHTVALRSNELNIASGTYQLTLITPQGYSTSKRIVIVK